MNRKDLGGSHHWVIKIGSAVLLRNGHDLDRLTFVSLVRSIHELIEAGHRVTVVSSGAVALGRPLVEPGQISSDLGTLQALAALGQARLIRQYDQEFREYGRRAAQILFGRSDLGRRQGFLNARMTLDAVHRLGAVPIINENDTVATEGLRFDDNDELAAMACGLVQADVLVLLSDVDGVFDVEVDKDGARRFGERIAQIEVDDPRLVEIAGPTTSGHGRGGMISKVAAARHAARLGVPTLIAPGKQDRVLERLRGGEDLGTLLLPGELQLQGRKVWVGAGAMPEGKLACDDGAVAAIQTRGASLLASGVVGVEGDFDEGAVVELVDAKERVFGRGIAVYPAVDLKRIAGHHSSEIMSILGYKSLDAVVHRDSLVLL